MCSKWRDKVDIAREIEGTMSKGEIRELAIGNRAEQATENRRPDGADNRTEPENGRGRQLKPATKRRLQPNTTGDETNRPKTGRRRLTITDNFGTYWRMCGFGRGECRSVFCTVREKCI